MGGCGKRGEGVGAGEIVWEQGRWEDVGAGEMGGYGSSVYCRVWKQGDGRVW